MFSGIQKIIRNIKATNYVFKNMHHVSTLFKYYTYSVGVFYDKSLENESTRQFYETFLRSDMPDRYMKLSKGLDQQSLADIADIINGITSLSLDGKKYQSVFKKVFLSAQELQENFYDKIVKLSDSLYAWQDYFFPVGRLDQACLYYRNGLNFVEHPERFASSPIIDAGGYIGDSIVVLSPYTKDNVYCFEPVPSHLPYIKKTIELNGISNAIIAPFALGNSCENINICLSGDLNNGAYVTSEDLNDSGVKTGPNQTSHIETVPQTTLDSYVEVNGLKDIGLIKMDIEGAERAALNGAKNVIKKYRPSLIISIYHNPDDFFDIKPMLESWDLGYTFKIRRCPGNLYSDTLLIAEVL